MRGLLPAVIVLVLAAASTKYAFFYQGALTAPQNRWRVGYGSFWYCWDTKAKWALTRTTTEYLSSGLMQGGVRKTINVMNLGWPPKGDDLVRPVTIMAGKVRIPLVYVAAMLSVPPLAWMLLVNRREAWMCQTCGYDLRGLDGESCPECGAAKVMSATVKNAARAEAAS